MQRIMMKSKIHRARVTAAKLHYQGSITIDKTLLMAADMLPYERVQVLNLDNGARIETYIIEGRKNAGQVQINGAAAHLFNKNDKVIIITYAMVKEQALDKFKPKVIWVDENNKIKRKKKSKVKLLNSK